MIFLGAYPLEEWSEDLAIMSESDRQNALERKAALGSADTLVDVGGVRHLGQRGA